MQTQSLTTAFEPLSPMYKLIPTDGETDIRFQVYSQSQLHSAGCSKSHEGFSFRFHRDDCGQLQDGLASIAYATTLRAAKDAGCKTQSPAAVVA